jgi:subtilisin family serine protease
VQSRFSSIPHYIVTGCFILTLVRSTTPLKGFASCPDGYALGCGLEQANEFLDAVEALVAVGIVVVVSAGNTYIPGRSACLSSPGKSDKVITVGGSTAQGRQWRNSKDGICVDIFAPAKDVTSAWAFSDRSTSVQSGTSIAAPIVAGVAALYLQRDSTMTPAAVKQAILDDAIKGVKWKGLLSPNRLVSTTGLM